MEFWKIIPILESWKINFKKLGYWKIEFQEWNFYCLRYQHLFL